MSTPLRSATSSPRYSLGQAPWVSSVYTGSLRARIAAHNLHARRILVRRLPALSEEVRPVRPVGWIGLVLVQHQKWLGNPLVNHFPPPPWLRPSQWSIIPASAYVGWRSRLCRARSYLRVVLGSACPAASWTSRRLAPASRLSVTNACLKCLSRYRLKQDYADLRVMPTFPQRCCSSRVNTQRVSA